MFSKESLEKLKEKVDLVELLSSHVQMKRSGSTYKACCPFHEEKTPSFIVGKGDRHYHCFGCGAHGDAIAFLMNYLSLSFSEAVESLAERFGVSLEVIEKKDLPTGPSKTDLRDALLHASRFFHFFLLHTDEGHHALSYLYDRGLDLEFIKRFKIGLAPKQNGHLTKYLRKMGAREAAFEATGLLKSGREFFSQRILFPILDGMGHTIGFSGRKYKEETFGGKYINTPETLLFKKSHTLFGLYESRKRIVKERRALVVEGQIDALRLIEEGIDFAIAGQGTAFGEGHVAQLAKLGVNQVYLALDGDDAGSEATVKIGDLFQKEGIEVFVVPMPPSMDPDSVLKEKGPKGFLDEVQRSQDYLAFLYQHLSNKVNISSPAAKNEIVGSIARRIRAWDHPLMVHESLRKLANLANVPENLIESSTTTTPNVFIKKTGSISQMQVDPNRVLEIDLLRWLLTAGQIVQPIAFTNLLPEDFFIPSCSKIFATLKEHAGEESFDLLTLATELGDAEHQLFLSEILQKKVNREKAAEGMRETLQKMLERNWMQRREEIKIRIHSGHGNEDELLTLAKEFDQLRRNPPQIKEVSTEHTVL